MEYGFNKIAQLVLQLSPLILFSFPVYIHGWFPGLNRDAVPNVLCAQAISYTEGNVRVEQRSPPFEVITDHKDFYLPGKSIQVEIKPKAGQNAKIQGAIIQVRQMGGLGTSPALNKRPSSDDKLLNCYSTADTLYLWENQPTTSLKATWTAPSEAKVLQFVVAVFEDPKTVWMNITSKPFEKGFEPIDLSTCGEKKGCFRYTHNSDGTCTTSTCEYIFTYRALENDNVQFEMSAKADWVAIGFSSDKLMGGDDVLMCETTQNGGAEINRYSNNQNYIKPTKQRNNPTSAHETELKDGRLSCRFRRPLTVNNDDESIIDLNNDWYQLYAWGTKSMSGNINRHIVQSPPTSPRKLTLLNLINVTSAATMSVASSLEFIFILIVTFLYNSL